MATMIMGLLRRRVGEKPSFGSVDEFEDDIASSIDALSLCEPELFDSDTRVKFCVL